MKLIVALNTKRSILVTKGREKLFPPNRTKTMRDSIKQDFTKAERKAYTAAKRAIEAAIKSERKAEQKAYRQSITKPAPKKAKIVPIAFIGEKPKFEMAKGFIPKNVKVQAITIIKK